MPVVCGGCNEATADVRFGANGDGRRRLALRRMSNLLPRRPVYFVLVGKTGGMPVDDLMMRIFKCTNRVYNVNVHYDWSFMRHCDRHCCRTYAIGNADDD